MKRLSNILFLLCLVYATAWADGNVSSSHKGHEYVDLGLPSGTLWANYNIGATKIEDVGDYYSWGETETKPSYTWDTYLNSIGGHFTFDECGTEKDPLASFFNEGKSISGTQYDVAHVKWGGAWRLPSSADAGELQNSQYCTNEQTVINGVYGRLFTSKVNGNKLFIPYTSAMKGNETDGFYYGCWTGDLSFHPNYALYIDLSRESTAGTQRSFGLCVRPVVYSKDIEKEISNVPGDVNGDFAVNETDYELLARYITGEDIDGFVEDNADMDGNGIVDIVDYQYIVNSIHNMEAPAPIVPDMKTTEGHDVRVVDSLMMNNKLTSAEEGVLTFRDLKGNEVPKVGDIIVSSNEKGSFLLKVKSVNNNGTNTVVETEEAAIEEAISNCNISETLDITPYLRAADSGAPIFGPIKASAIRRSNAPRRKALGTKFSFGPSLSLKSDNSPLSLKTAITGSVGASFDFNMTVVDHKLKTLMTWFEFEFDADWTLSGELQAKLLNLSDSIGIPLCDIPITFAVGPIPVELTCTPALYFKLGAGGKVVADVKILELKATHRVGFTYMGDADRYTRINQRHSDGIQFFKGGKLDVEAEIELKAGAKGSVKLYDFKNTSASLDAGISNKLKFSNMTSNIGKDGTLSYGYWNPMCQYNLTVPAKVEASLWKFKKEILGHDLSLAWNCSWNIVNLDLFKANLRPSFSTSVSTKPNNEITVLSTFPGAQLAFQGDFYDIQEWGICRVERLDENSGCSMDDFLKTKRTKIVTSKTEVQSLDENMVGITIPYEKNKYYYFCPYYVSDGKTHYGEITTFYDAGQVITLPATDVAANSAVLHGEIGNFKTTSSTVTDCSVSFEYTTDTKSGSPKVAVSTLSSDGKTFSSTVKELSASTDYYYRACLAYVDFSSGMRENKTAYGEWMKFTTAKQTDDRISSLTFSVTSATMKVGEYKTIGVTIAPQTATNQKLLWSSSDTSVATVDDKGQVHALKAGSCTVSAKTTDGSNLTATCDITVVGNDTPGGDANGHEYVDLGLSVKWATCNVGASSPEDYGWYFAWGETKPKEVYNWSTYKWCNGSYDTMTKYCTSSSDGTVDNKTTLELADDAARANWGGSWRMPTITEQIELQAKCTWTWTEQNGKNGYKITSKINGNSIFLPAAGYRYDSSLDGAGSYGYYWSSSLYESFPSYAYFLYFNSGYVIWSGINRYFGHSVRAVCQ